MLPLCCAATAQLPIHIVAPVSFSGESCFSRAARTGGYSGLTARLEEYARLLPDVLESRLPAVIDIVTCVLGVVT
jgi:hypothetical protein